MDGFWCPLGNTDDSFWNVVFCWSGARIDLKFWAGTVLREEWMLIYSRKDRWFVSKLFSLARAEIACTDWVGKVFKVLRIWVEEETGILFWWGGSVLLRVAERVDGSELRTMFVRLVALMRIWGSDYFLSKCVLVIHYLGVQYEGGVRVVVDIRCSRLFFEIRLVYFTTCL